MARKNSVVSVAIDNAAIVFTVEGIGDITVNVPELDESIRERATYHGLVQKISDAAALGKGATPAEKHAAMLAVAERLIAGEWKQSRGEGAGPVAGIIFRAFSQWVADMAKKAKKDAPSAEAVRALYDSKTRAEQLAFRNVPAIATIIETMKAERGPAKSVDTDELLAGLGL